jgi:hypothetical protein
MWFHIPQALLCPVVAHPGQTIVPEPKMTLRPQNGILMTVRHRHQVEGNLFHQ